jgi:hypothetical protein
MHASSGNSIPRKMLHDPPVFCRRKRKRLHYKIIPETERLCSDRFCDSLNRRLLTKELLTTLVSTVLFLGASPVIVQDWFGDGLRVGPDFATQDLGDANLDTGFGSEVVLSYRFLSHLGAYGEWGYGRASIHRSVCACSSECARAGRRLRYDRHAPRRDRQQREQLGAAAPSERPAFAGSTNPPGRRPESHDVRPDLSPPE